MTASVFRQNSSHLHSLVFWLTTSVYLVSNFWLSIKGLATGQLKISLTTELNTRYATLNRTDHETESTRNILNLKKCKQHKLKQLSCGQH